MESSDDSFAWMSASGGSEDSDDTIIEKMNKSNHFEESESGKSYKKKLQKQLFQENELIYTYEDEGQSKKAKKIKVKKEQLDDEREPSHSEPPDDLYLALRVKQEQANAPADHKHTTLTSKKKSKKNKHSHMSSDINNDGNEGGKVYELKQEADNPDDRQNLNRKKKKIRYISASDYNNDVKDLIIEDHFSAEETIVETRREQHTILNSHETEETLVKPLEEERRLNEKVTISYSSKEFVSEDSSSDESIKANSLKKRKPSATDASVDNSVSQESSNCERNVNKIQTKETSKKSVVNICHGLADTASTTKSKLSDRIRFEDDPMVDMTVSEHRETREQSARLRRFLRANPNLRSFGSILKCASFITEDDELWLLKCPHEIDIKTLKDMDLSIDHKCKVKFDGHTYDGSLQEAPHQITILSFENNKPAIKNIPVMGTINFRRRIPKPHFIDDNVMANNQTNFIPLPDTKCRHPLFGPNYKRAMKIPSLVKARLNPIHIEMFQSCTEKKKKKKHKRLENDIPEPQSKVPAKIEPQPLHEEGTKKKKRKCKYTYIDDEPAPKKIKRIKHDPESAEAWASEKAIEENLFNF